MAANIVGKGRYRGRDTCRGCIYNRYIDGSLRCNYALDTEELRGCPADNCDKYVAKTPLHIARNKALITEIRNGLKTHELSYIATRYGLSQKAIKEALAIYEGTPEEVTANVDAVFKAHPAKDKGIVQKCIELHEQGYSAAKIAEMIGISSSTVSRITKSDKGRRKRSYTDADRQKAYDLWERGYSYTRVANSLDIPLPTIKTWLQNYKKRACN